MSGNRFHDLLALNLTLDEARAFIIPREEAHGGRTIGEVGGTPEGLAWLRERFTRPICPIGYKAALFVYLESRMGDGAV